MPVRQTHYVPKLCINDIDRLLQSALILMTFGAIQSAIDSYKRLLNS